MATRFFLGINILQDVAQFISQSQRQLVVKQESSILYKILFTGTKLNWCMDGYNKVDGSLFTTTVNCEKLYEQMWDILLHTSKL